MLASRQGSQPDGKCQDDQKEEQGVVAPNDS